MLRIADSEHLHDLTEYQLSVTKSGLFLRPLSMEKTWMTEKRGPWGKRKWERGFLNWFLIPVGLNPHAIHPSFLFSFNNVGLEGKKLDWKQNASPGEKEIWIVIHTTEHTYQLVEVCNDDCLCSHQRAFMHLHFEFDTDAKGNMYVWDCSMANLHYFLDWLIGWLTTVIYLLPLKRFSAVWLSVRGGLFFSRSSHLQQSGKEKQP